MQQYKIHCRFDGPLRLLENRRADIGWVVLLSLHFFTGCTRQLPVAPPTTQAVVSTIEGVPESDASKLDGETEQAAISDASASDDDPSQVQTAAEKQPSAANSLAWKPSGDWTRQRLIVLVETGPCLVDLSISIGGQNLEQAAAEQLMVVTKELLAELKQPAKWEDLLQLPLVRSGWLGNLLPEEGQREQVISLYDTERDGLVAEDELPAFLSRGLARLAPFQLSDVGYADDQDPSQSPWGKGDRNQDHSLDQQEREEFAQTVMRQDLNADGLLSRGELAGGMNARLSNMNGNRSNALRVTSLMLAEPGSESESAATSKGARKLASDVLRHTTFLAELSREQWPDWSDAQWEYFDKNGNQKVDQFELQRLVDAPPHAHLYVTLPSSSQHSTGQHSTGQQSTGQMSDGAVKVAMHVHASLNEPSAAWQESEVGGLLRCTGCSIRVELTDAFSQLGQMQLRQQLGQALKNPQFKTFFVQRLQLDQTAFDLLDEDHDEALSDEEFDRVWSWLTCRQGSRLLGRWMLTSQPWFQLADADADFRLSSLELQEFAPGLERLDRDGDALVTPNELPLVATLSLSRSDSRLELPLSGAGLVSTPAVDADWFSAMDTNRDGSVSPSEFLGEMELFSRSDVNGDGFLSRGEVYFPKTSN